MSKNLFNYATKELSQDAFLMWLLESFDDPIVGKASCKLIKKLAEVSGNDSFDSSKITKVVTYAQWKHIDIFADVFIGNDKYGFVIEDKTYSKEHNQLEKYDNSITTLTDYKDIYRIFYKTSHIEEDELSRVNEAKWNLFNLQSIHDVFAEFMESPNDILSQYAEYVVSRFEQENSISSKPSEEWELEDWKTYIRLKLTPALQKEISSGIEVYTWAYQGRYVSAGVYYPDRLFGINKPLMEFFFRKTGSIAANVHVETLGQNDNWNVEHRTEEFKEKFDALFGSGQMPSFKKINTKLCIAKLAKPIDRTLGIDEITSKIVEAFKEFYLFFKEFER